MTISDLGAPGARSANAVRAVRTRDVHLYAPLMMDTLVQPEIDLEMAAYDNGVVRYRKNVAQAERRGEGASLKPAQRLLQHCFSIVSGTIKDEIDACAAGEYDKCRSIYGPILQQLDHEVLAVIALHEAVSACMCAPNGVKTTTLAHNIGRAVFAEINLHILAKTAKEAYKEFNRRFRFEQQPWRVNWWARKNTSDAIRDLKAQVHVGAKLIGILIDSTSIGEGPEWSPKRNPMLLSDLRIMPGGRKRLYVKMTYGALKIIDDGHAVRKTMRPHYVPMIIKPCRWCKESDGGYIRIRTPFIAKPTHTQKAMLESADLEPVWDALDALTAVPHRGNKFIRKWQGIVWDTGGNALGIPRQNALPEPPHPAGYNWDKTILRDGKLVGQKGCWEGVDAQAKREYKAAAFAVIEQNREDASARESLLKKHQVFDLMAPYPKFYFPHQLCFRGRAYPVPPHLNHSNDDIARGLLEWGEYVEPGEEGRRELLIEAANQYGYDKLCFADRVQWAQDHEKQIAQAAKDPLDSDWWHPRFDKGGKQVSGAENPWQFLAICHALNDREAAGHATVWRDGSCNGLQHLSALARDPVGGAAVNLLPSDVPADVYGQVADAVRPIVGADRYREDAIVRFKQRTKVGDGWVTRDMDTTLAVIASMIYDCVDRDTCKPNVMTNVYGVTFVGAAKQALRKLEKRGVTGPLLYTASRYLARTTLGAIGEVCAGAKQIMDWFRDCAQVVAAGDKKKGVRGEAVRWTIPLGLPCVQPYRRYSVETIETASWELEKIIPDDSVPVHVGRQRSGFSPNVTHGIDASHMFVQAQECRTLGISFAARHDAFGTHAAHRKSLDRITRSTFVTLHRRHLLTELVDELRMRSPELDIPSPPALGTLDIGRIMDSEYAFA